MKKIHLLILFLVVHTSLVGQVKVDSIIRNYKISLIERPQTIELIEYSNNNYSGKIITEWTKGSINNSWIKRAWDNLMNKDWVQIKECQNLDKNVVTYLVSKLNELGIETIKECNFDNDYCGSMFLDGNSYKFIIRTKVVNRRYYFDEIYPSNGKNLEKNETRRQAQRFITLIYENIDLNKYYSEAVTKLDKGRYFYSRGAGVIQFKIRNRKK